MKTFTDSQGREWTIALNLGTAMMIKDRLGLDLLQPELGDPPLLTRIGTDEMLLGEVLCAFLSDQFVKYDLDETGVKMAFDGETLLAAQEAFYGELADFFRSRGRNDRTKAIEKQQALIQAAIKANEARVDGFDVAETIRNVVSEQSESNHGMTSGESPEASEWTPAP